MDIKSHDLAGAEIGYWAAAAHSGIITPALGAVCGLAQAAGYKSLFAYVVPHNNRSIRVLESNGFALESKNVEYKDKTCDLYRRAL